MAEVVIENVRLSYLNCWEPKPNLSGVLKYGASCLISQEDKPMLDRINKAISEAIQAAITAGKLNKAAAPSVLSPLRDGTAEYKMEKKDVSYNGFSFFNANSDNPPTVVDRNVQQIFDKDEVYSGCWANVAVSFYFTAAGGTPRVAVGLNHIMKLKDDDRLDGRTNVQDAFAKYAPVDDPGPVESDSDLA